MVNIFIDNKSGAPIYDQIYSQIKNQIISGALQENEMLPSIRGLAKDLRISFITTKRAYEELERDGFITTVIGKGSFVRAADTRLLREEKLKQVEGLLSAAVSLAGQSGISREEVEEILTIIYQEA